MGNKLRLMVIDDEPIVGKRLKRLFEKDGYDVEAFTHGSSAIMAMDNKPFDIIITDIKMENIDGLKILRTAKNKNPKTKVIIITGFGRKVTAREAVDMGAFDFIAKPFKVNALKQAVRRAQEELKNGS